MYAPAPLPRTAASGEWAFVEGAGSPPSSLPRLHRLRRRLSELIKAESMLDAHNGHGWRKVREVPVLRPDLGVVGDSRGGYPGVVYARLAAGGEHVRRELGIGRGSALVDR